MTELLRYKTANPSFEVPWVDARFLDALPSSPDLAPKQPPPQLSAQHLKEMEELKNRLKRCALVQYCCPPHWQRSIFAAAEQGDVPLLIDAEQTWFQSAIDYLSLSFMPEYNSKKAIIYNTYQMYLKDALPRLKLDLGAPLLAQWPSAHISYTEHAERARKGNYKFGAKLVRGAYMIAGSFPLTIA